MQEIVLVLFPVEPINISFVGLGGSDKYIPPLYFHDAIEQLNDFIHTAIRNKGVDPSDRFIPQQEAKFVHFAYLHHLRLLDLS